MNFRVVAKTDKGIIKKVNQDSLLYKHARYKGAEIVMAIICDGMGGLEKGELASGAVVKKFCKWFDKKITFRLNDLNLNVIAKEWEDMLEEINKRMLTYSKEKSISMGTTFTGILFVDDDYLLVHVGDTRLYYIDSYIKQLTTDHTFIEREIRSGRLSPSEAKKDKRRNMLLQCVGASKNLRAELKTGIIKSGVYLLCSDGFRHELTEAEMLEYLKIEELKDKKEMANRLEYLIELVKKRMEKDNISAILIKAE